MAMVKDIMLWTLVHDFFKLYLPNQRGSSPHTIKSYKKALDSLFDFVKNTKEIPLANITFKMIDYEMLTMFLDSIEANGCSVSTRNLRLNCIRAFYSYVAKMESAAIIYCEEIRKVSLKKSSEPNVVEYMSESAVKAILNAPDTSTKKGLRDQFLLMIFYDTGARISEVLGIRLCDLKLGKTPTVMIFGKGGKCRIVPLSEKTAEHFHNYASVYHGGVELYSECFLFYNANIGSHKPLKETAVRDLMNAHSQSAKKVCNEVPEKIHPHLWRHSRAMHLYQHGMDLTLISQWLGHSKLETTLIYANADTEHKRKAIERAVDSDSPLQSLVNPERFCIDDEEMLKRLYGLS